MIPDLEDGVLPVGVYDCTFAELEAVFGRFQKTDRRINLTAKLKAYLEDAGRSGLVVHVNSLKHPTLTSRERKGVLRIKP